MTGRRFLLPLLGFAAAGTILFRRLGSSWKGGLLAYEGELPGRGVWHLHVVVGMETAVERAWAFEYVRALRELGSRYGFGFVPVLYFCCSATTAD